MKFLRACEDDRGNFNASRAETTLRDAWVTEKMLLQDGRDYWISLEGSGFDGEITSTERIWLDYDSLGHFVLCLLDRRAKWKSFVMKYHPNVLLPIGSAECRISAGKSVSC